MKVELIANLSANGQLILAAHGNSYEAPSDVVNIWFQKAMECGNIIIGRTTYDLIAPMMKKALSNLEVVVFTSKPLPDPFHTVTSAGEAVSYLEEKGFEKACVAGGTQTYNAFLRSNCCDEMFFNLFPIVIHGGGMLETALGQILRGYKLDYAKANGNVAMLHFVKGSL